MKNDKIRLVAILVLSIMVILTGALYGIKAFSNGDIMGGIIGIIFALIIFSFAFLIYRRGNKDLKKGFPLKDERSKKVMEKASSLAFFISIYLLLGIGFLSDKIPFRDISQATSFAIGLMALIFALSWLYYNKKEL